MKLINRYISVLAAGLVAVSCVGDLDTIPLDPSETVSENAYGTDESAYISGLARIYFQFVSNDLTDLQPMDGGASEIIRAFWSTQETTCDAVKCAWENDDWVRALNTNTWNEAQNPAAYAVYVRALQGITFANEYLRQTSEDVLRSRGVSNDLITKIDSFRAEARFLRAYLYWMAMDTFGSVPFTTEESPFGGTYNPKQVSRTELFNFLVGELKDLMSDSSAMPAPRSNYPRADKGSAAGLLARLYLNAEVYTSVRGTAGEIITPGTPMWNEAKDVCEKIFDMGYSLCPEYAHLFRGDNGENAAARNEMLWTVAYDAESTQSYGGTTYMLCASLAANDVTDVCKPNGQVNGWAGLRAPFEYVDKYFAPTGISEKNDKGEYIENTYTIKDKRGQMFYIKGRMESMQDNLYNFLNGWSCLKYNNYPSTVKDVLNADADALKTASLKSYSDIDFPMIRLGEIYLIYAEACMHAGGDASTYVKALADRAGVAAPSKVDQDFLVAERARELMWEGHRRTDLIRYNLFAGEDVDFNWVYKNESPSGKPFPGYKYIFSIPQSELTANPDLVQNPGYLSVN